MGTQEQAPLPGFLQSGSQSAIFCREMLLVRHGQSEFNAVYARTRVDPGIPDPKLTDEGRRQAVDAAALLAERGIRRLLASPYTRAIETAEILGRLLDIPVAIEPLVRERAAFFCDIGSPRDALQSRFPALSFAHLDDPWWHDHVALGRDESEGEIHSRAAQFRAQVARLADRDSVAVVTHWGFIRAMTGIEAKNAEILRVRFDSGDLPD